MKKERKHMFMSKLMLFFLVVAILGSLYQPSIDTDTVSVKEKSLDYVTAGLPTAELASPTNGSTTVTIKPHLSVRCNDSDGNNLNVTFYSNYSGSWTTLQANNTVSANSTVKCYFTQANVQNTKYWWNVSVYDGTDNVSYEFYFTTTSNAPSLSTPLPGNQSLSVCNCTDNVNITITDADGDPFNWTIETSTGESNSGNLTANGVKVCNLTTPLTNLETIYWWVNVTDANASTSAQYWFQVQKNTTGYPYNYQTVEKWEELDWTIIDGTSVDPTRVNVTLDRNSTINGTKCINISRDASQEGGENFQIIVNLSEGGYTEYSDNNGFLTDDFSFRFMVEKATGAGVYLFEFHTCIDRAPVTFSHDISLMLLTNYTFRVTSSNPSPNTYHYFSNMPLQFNTSYTLLFSNIRYGCTDSIGTNNIADITLSNATASQTLTDIYSNRDTWAAGQIKPITRLSISGASAPSQTKLFIDNWINGSYLGSLDPYDISVTKEANATYWTKNQTYTYWINVTNDGYLPLSNIFINETYDSDCTYVSNTSTPANDSWYGTDSWRWDSLDPGNTISMTIVVNATGDNMSTVRNSVNVSADGATTVTASVTTYIGARSSQIRINYYTPMGALLSSSLAALLLMIVLAIVLAAVAVILVFMKLRKSGGPI